MPTPCVIRLTDDDGDRRSHVKRKQHGHPEEVITNLAYLHATVENQSVQLSPGNVAAQFIALDTLWCMLKAVPTGEVEDELWVMLFHPDRLSDRGEPYYLQQHAVIDGQNPIWPVPFLYEVQVDESDWQVRIGHFKGSSPRPVGEMFQLVSWGFGGTLTEAIGRFQ